MGRALVLALIPSANALGRDTVEVTCQNCGHRRYMVWAVARLLQRDDQGRYLTEVCHHCLNRESGVGRTEIYLAPCEESQRLPKGGQGEQAAGPRSSPR